MLFGAGIPLLYLIFAVQMIVIYWIDKLFCKPSSLINNHYDIVLRVYKTPPRYSAELSDITRNLMYYGLLLHIIVSFFMFTNTKIFNETSF